MLRRGIDLTQRASFDLGGLTKLHCCLDPSVEVVLALGWQRFLHLMIGVPVEACDEVVMMRSAGQSVYALILGLLEQGPFQLPPRLLQVKLIAQHERSFRSVPSHQVGSLPAPFLVICGFPGLFQCCQLLRGPGMDKAVDGSDVVDDDLISWINVLFVVEIIGAV